MYTLNDILDEGQSFKIECSLIFHNMYIVHVMKYIFLNYVA